MDLEEEITSRYARDRETVRLDQSALDGDLARAAQQECLDQQQFDMEGIEMGEALAQLEEDRLFAQRLQQQEEVNAAERSEQDEANARSAWIAQQVEINIAQQRSEREAARRNAYLAHQ